MGYCCALHRFERIEPMAETATQPAGFDLDEHIGTRIIQYPAENAEPIALELRMEAGAANHLHETPLSEAQSIHEDPEEPGWVRVEAQVPYTEQLYWWLLGFGGSVEVLAPESLHAKMMAAVREMIWRYDIG